MSKYYNAFQGFVKAFTGAAKPGVKGNPTTIIGVAPSKNIKKFTDQKEKIISSVDKNSKKVDTPEAKKEMKKGVSGTLSNISKIYKGEPITKKVKSDLGSVKKKVEKKAMGGRMGYKGGSDDGSNLNKSINSLKRIMEDKKFPKKNKFSRRDRSPMERQRVLDTMKSKAQAMGGNVRTAGEMSPLKGESMKSFKERTEAKVGGRMGYKKGSNGGGMSDTQVKKKFKNLGNLPESIQIKIAGKKVAKKV